jgi:hypothetical protein
MKNAIILGFGRSGTSLMGGILYHSGYFMGENLFPPRESNPKGFFENDFINGINERILSTYDFHKLHVVDSQQLDVQSPFNPKYGQRWLSFINPELQIQSENSTVIEDIKLAVDMPVFAYKDPRFNYTLGVWNRFLPTDVVKICMFRQPDITVNSVLKDCKTADYLQKFQIDEHVVFELWYNNYQRVLGYADAHPLENIIFIHYEQLLDRIILPTLSDILEVSLDTGFIAKDLNRSKSAGAAPEKVREVYAELCKKSGHAS